MATIPLFENPCVRDIAWACFGQNLINDFEALGDTKGVQHCHITLTEARAQWLQQLDQDPTLLLDHLSGLRSPRIGLYFEALWQFFISQDPHLELLAHNLQVSQNKKTYGEFDLIYRDSTTGRNYHLELAIKFYLNHSLSANQGSFSADFHYWLGPNAIDRLDIKTEHLLNHQVQLSTSDAGKAALSLLGVDDVIQEIAIKGRLFYPYTINPEPSPTALSSAHNYSHWLNFSNLKVNIQCCEEWLILDRSEWISPMYGEETQLKPRVKNQQQLGTLLRAYFTNNTQPLIISGLEKSNTHYQEKLRFFITADKWPEKAS